MSRNFPPDFSPEINRRAVLKGLAAAPLLAIGCGADTYEQRLQQTKDYFAYLERVNQALGPKTVPFEGVEIRVPKPFEQVIPPPPPTDDQPAEQPAATSEDPSRLGYHPEVSLEGVLATWKAAVDVDTSSEGKSMAYLHLLSNLPRWVEKQTNNDIEPLHYFGELTNVLANAYNVQTDTSDAPWPWESLRGFAPYVGKKKVESIAIPPDTEPINAILYRLDVKDIQVGLLLIFPRAIDSRLKLEDRLKHTLETLKVPAQPPQKKSGSQPVGGF